jgi:superfamily II DNA or RNA helicase
VEELKITYYKDRRCVIDPDNRYFNIIRNNFSYDNPAARFSMYSRLPKRLYTITTKGYCDIGFIWIIQKFIKDEGWDLKLKISDRVKKLMINPIKVDIKEVPNKKYKLRDYQIDCIGKAFNDGGGITLVGTGGGKSLIQAAMLESFYHADNDFKAIVVVPSIGLIKQLYDDFKEYGCSFSISKWSGKISLHDNTTNVIIVNTGFLQRFTDEKKQEFSYLFKRAKYLLYDEVHLFGGEPEPKASVLLKEYHYDHVFGFTGSLDDSSFGSNRVYGYFGRVFYEKTSKELRDENYLSNAFIKMVRLNHDPDIFGDIYDFENKNEVENYNLELDYMIASEKRNGVIKSITKKLDGNVLILVERIIHGQILLDVLKDLNDKQVFFIRGETDVEERQRIIELMENNSNIVCIAMSKIFSTGINIKNLPYVVFGSIGKAWYKIIQAIGRGLRLHKDKKLLIIFDLCDNLIFSEKQSKHRMNIYEKQQIDYKEYGING